jgi:hypothetical protein
MTSDAKLPPPVERQAQKPTGTGLGDEGVHVTDSLTAELVSARMWSQQVSWWSVHEFVAPYLDRVGTWPMVGSPEWCALADDDPRKLAALLDGARHWALRVETCQEAECDASHAISAAADWGVIAQRVRDRADFEKQHPWLRRVAS